MLIASQLAQAFKRNTDAMDLFFQGFLFHSPGLHAPVGHWDFNALVLLLEKQRKSGIYTRRFRLLQQASTRAVKI